MATEVMKKCFALWILIETFILAVLGAPPSFDGVCPEYMSEVMSHCLVTYQQKIQHMHRANQDFYTGIDMEEMRSICSATKRAAKCVRDTKANCPNLDEDPVYPSDLIAVFNLCHYRDFHETYSINQFCYANVRSSTETCYQRFETHTEHHLPNVLLDNPTAIRNYCSKFDELVNCIWAIALSKCGDQEADFIEALVRPAVPYSDKCIKVDGSTTTSTTTTETPYIYRYNENSNNNNRDSNSNSQTQEHDGNTASTMFHLINWLCLLLLLNFVGDLMR